MKITTTVWNFVIREANYFKLVITRGASWVFKLFVYSWKFVITRQNEWTFKIIPAGYWILRDGFWDDNGIWVDAETWRDS